MKQKILKILKIVVIIICVIFAIVLIKKIINKEEIPFITNQNSYVVLSGSMEPEISIGDIVISKKTSIDEIRKGDIITFNTQNMMVTHRVVEITNDEGGRIRYITKGDNNNANDIGTIGFENIVGKYSSKIPKLGYVVLFIQKYLALVITVFIFIIVFIITKKKQTE